ncbi:radical SAM protein [Tumebacillus permanentifrigoris]|uniref:Radical SAM protein n=1 Tax=Tumebacillus permanentifrigoris TaxID=378543 RepID=A0A316D6G3_9BACL|nr:radical SAM protein [Tumebacillus permanentifrigoris]PWK10184.1 hypothetical protein C7459_1125 [Tumebacillus permanentifrigoris]
MRIGILDIDTKKEKMGHGKHEKFPNLACGKIFGYHMERGDEIVYPWKGERVDKLYISTIFSWSRQALERQMPYFKSRADEVVVGGTGADWRSKLPPEMENIGHQWTYDLYDIDYGIGFTIRGCHVGCSFCVVPRKEGLREYRVATVGELVNPRSNHLVLLNNNSLADIGFFEDVEEIRERGLTVNWNQANDITLVTDRHAEALASVKYYNFAKTSRMLHFSWDQMIKRKIDPATGQRVEYVMSKTVPEQIARLKAHGIPPHHLTFYMLIGFDTTLEEDMHRFRTLRELGCEVYAMQFRDLNGKNGVDGKGNPQLPHVRHLKKWVNGRGFKACSFEEFRPYMDEIERREKDQREQAAQTALDLFAV